MVLKIISRRPQKRRNSNLHKRIKKNNAAAREITTRSEMQRRHFSKNFRHNAQINSFPSSPEEKDKYDP